MAPATKENRGPATRGRARPDGQGQHPQKHRASVDSNTLQEQCHPRKVFIGGLAHKTTTQHIRDHFGRFGNIVDAVVLRWPDGRSRGFGYVTFADSSAAASVLQESHSLSGRDVEVKRAVPGTNKLFAGGLPQNTTANELRDHFEQFGVVSDAVVMIDPVTSRSRGFGFVCFLPGQEGATAVTESLAQYDNHRIRGKWIEVKSAAPPHKLAGKNGAQDGQVSYEEQALAGGASQGPTHCPPAPAAAPSMETRKSNQRKAGASALGSPRKVSLPASADMLGAPPGLAPMPSNGFDGANAEMPMFNPWAANPWSANPWAASPWPQPFGAMAPFGAMPPFGAPTMDPLSMSNPWNSPAAGYPYSTRISRHPDQTGLSPAESLQQNLERFLRQSVQDKMDKELSKGTPSVEGDSTTCSATTQAEIAQAAALLHHTEL